MSRVIPTNDLVDGDNNAQQLCPRYQNWLKRVAELHRNTRRVRSRRQRFSRSKGRGGGGVQPRDFDQEPECRQVCRRANYATNSKRNTQAMTKKKISGSFSNHSLSGQKRPRRSNTLFVKIREKSRNFGIRCRTSVALWRKWIVNGLKPKDDQDDDDATVESNKLKNADISIVKTKPKSENKIKDFLKKTIVNEVIPEEDESSEIEATIKKPASAEGKNQTPAHQAKGSDPKIIVTDGSGAPQKTSNTKQSKASTPPSSSSSSPPPPKEMVEVTEVITKKSTNTTNLEVSPASLPPPAPSTPAKVSNGKSKSNTLQHDPFGFGIEEVEDTSDDDDEYDSDDNEDFGGGKPPAARLNRSNAIKRAFNKIRLLF